MLFRNLSLAELFELEEVAHLFECAIAHLETSTVGRDISIDDLFEALKTHVEGMLQDALNNTLKAV